MYMKYKIPYTWLLYHFGNSSTVSEPGTPSGVDDQWHRERYFETECPYGPGSPIPNNNLFEIVLVVPEKFF